MVVSLTQVLLTPTPAISKPPTQVQPSSASPTNADVCNSITVDFNKDANGANLPSGLYVENEWNEFGFRLSTKEGVGKKPHLFITVNPCTEQLSHPDLGSPND